MPYVGDNLTYSAGARRSQAGQIDREYPIGYRFSFSFSFSFSSSRVEWSFLQRIVTAKMGFPCTWIKAVMECVPWTLSLMNMVYLSKMVFWLVHAYKLKNANILNKKRCMYI
jgi:hypothetical protein